MHVAVWHQVAFTNKFKTVLSAVIYKMYIDYIFRAFYESSENITDMTILIKGMKIMPTPLYWNSKPAYIGN